MHVGLKVATYAAVLAATFGTAYGVGTALDPVADPKPATHTEHTPARDSGHGDGGGNGHDGHTPQR
ncbi:hypothetical protein [Streptomyces sp. NPDC057702]|uniref:hypothetical protein n=1 Tax=unclassified Streptomyces TaxID=2593676 RepID=UPI0036AD29DE